MGRSFSRRLRPTGFTLIELLVVIAIIGLLASIILVATNSARSKARDAKRKVDLHEIATALEEFYEQNGGYPATGATSADDTGTGHTANTNPNVTTWATLLANPLINAGLMAVVPVDPLNAPSGAFEWGGSIPGYSVNDLYHYRSNGTTGGTDATHYIICAWMENHSDPSTLQYSDVGDPFNPGTFLHANDNYSAYNYCISQ